MRSTSISLVSLFVFAVAASASGDQPLVQAAKRNDAAAVRALLRQPVDVNVTEGDGATALHWAAYHGNTAIAD